MRTWESYSVTWLGAVGPTQQIADANLQHQHQLLIQVVDANYVKHAFLLKCAPAWNDQAKASVRSTGMQTDVRLVLLQVQGDSHQLCTASSHSHRLGWVRLIWQQGYATQSHKISISCWFWWVMCNQGVQWLGVENFSNALMQNYINLVSTASFSSRSDLWLIIYPCVVVNSSTVSILIYAKFSIKWWFLQLKWTVSLFIPVAHAELHSFATVVTCWKRGQMELIFLEL